MMAFLKAYWKWTASTIDLKLTDACPHHFGAACYIRTFWISAFRNLTIKKLPCQNAICHHFPSVPFVVSKNWLATVLSPPGLVQLSVKWQTQPLCLLLLLCLSFQSNLKPAEDLWEFLEWRIRQCSSTSSSKHHLKENLLKEWCSMTLAQFHQLVESMASL